MRAAVVHDLGDAPVFGELPEPAPAEGEALIDVLAATINPIDIAICSGSSFAGRPPTPYTPGIEGVGTLRAGHGAPSGTLVRFEGVAGRSRHGSLAERAVAPAEHLIELPADTDPAVAACLGIAGLAAWLGLSWRGRLSGGEHVLILGASGAVGQVAVQAARLLGAGRVTAAARSRRGLERASQLGADAVALLDTDDPEALAARLRDAAGGEVDLVLDPLWGAPAAAALGLLSTGGRLVNIGQSAGAVASVASAPVRSRNRAILGFIVFLAPWGVKGDALRAMLEHAGAGRLVVEREIVPLEQVAAAWERQAASPQCKLVFEPAVRS